MNETYTVSVLLLYFIVVYIVGLGYVLNLFVNFNNNVEHTTSISVKFAICFLIFICSPFFMPFIIGGILFNASNSD